MENCKLHDIYSNSFEIESTYKTSGSKYFESMISVTNELKCNDFALKLQVKSI